MSDQQPLVPPSVPQDPPAAAGGGLRAVTAEHFSFADAVGGVRGVVEAVLPGLVFVVVFVASSNLAWSLGAAVAAALVAVVARLVQRAPATQALGGLLGIGVGVVWAWRSGEAGDFYVWGLVTNAAYLVAVLASILLRWPVVGFVVEALRAGFGADQARARAAEGASPFAGVTAWRRDPELVRPVEGARRVLDRLRAQGIAVGVVSNQSGIGRGFLTPEQVRAVEARVEELLGPFATWQRCPHTPDERCVCRKPEPGMVLRAAGELGVLPAECAVVGDIGADVGAAVAAGARAVLVPTPETRAEEVAAAPRVAADLAEAVRLL